MKKALVQPFGKTFLSLRHRNFRLFLLGQLVSGTGNWLNNIALILLVLKLTESGFAVGLITACQFGPILFLSAWAGAIADRFDKRRLLLVTQSLEMAQSIGLATLAFMPNPPLEGLYGLALLGGILLAFDNPFRRSFVTELVPKHDLPNAVALFSTMVNLARIFGPVLAGLLVVTVGFGWCFTIDSFSYGAVLLGILLMRPGELYRREKSQLKATVWDGVRYIRSIPSLWISFVMLAAIGMLVYNFNVTLPLFVTDSLHGTDTAYTLLYSVLSLGSVVCTLFVAHKSLVSMRYSIFGAGGLGVTMLLFAFVPAVIFAFPVIFVLGMASALYITATVSLAQAEATHEMHGRVLSLQTVFYGGTTIFGGPFSGWLADILDPRAPIIFGGIVCLAAASFGYFASKRYIPRAFEKEIVLKEPLESTVER